MYAAKPSSASVEASRARRAAKVGDPRESRVVAHDGRGGVERVEPQCETSDEIPACVQAGRARWLVQSGCAAEAESKRTEGGLTTTRKRPATSRALCEVVRARLWLLPAGSPVSGSMCCFSMVESRVRVRSRRPPNPFGLPPPPDHRRRSASPPTVNKPTTQGAEGWQSSCMHRSARQQTDFALTFGARTINSRPCLAFVRSPSEPLIRACLGRLLLECLALDPPTAAFAASAAPATRWATRNLSSRNTSPRSRGRQELQGPRRLQHRRARRSSSRFPLRRRTTCTSGRSTSACPRRCQRSRASSPVGSASPRSGR